MVYFLRNGLSSDTERERETLFFYIITNELQIRKYRCMWCMWCTLRLRSSNLIARKRNLNELMRFTKI